MDRNKPTWQESLGIYFDNKDFDNKEKEIKELRKLNVDLVVELKYLAEAVRLSGWHKSTYGQALELVAKAEKLK